jgi:hypothetical protein
VTLFSQAEMASIIGEWAEPIVVLRAAATVTDPLTGVGTAGGITTGTLRCSVQPSSGPRRVDQTGGTSTAGNVKVFVADSVTVQLDGDPPTDGGALIPAKGEGATGAPPDHIVWRGHKWRILEASEWTEGVHIQYLASDEGAV